MTQHGRASCRVEVDGCRVGVLGDCPTERTFEGVVLGLVLAMGSLSIFHVGVLVDDRHHVAHSLGVALEHLPP